MKANLAATEAAALLQAGAVIAYPCEAVYGLGCDPRQPNALKRLLAIKQRAADKGLILIASEFTQLSDYLLVQETQLKKAILASWPGPTTWLLAAKPGVSPLLRGSYNTQAVRVSAHPPVRALCQAFDHAVVSTSANRAGSAPLTTASAVAQALGDEIDGIVAGSCGDALKPTIIRDGQSGAIIRA